VEKALGVAPPETISIDPERPLYEACRRMLESRARRIPLVTNDSQTDRPHVLSVVTQYRILKFVAVNVSDTQKLKKPLKEILLGTYDNIATASMDTPVIDVIHILVERSISSVPILNSEGVVYNVFEAVDVITLIKGGVYDDLSLTVGEALKKRSAVRSLYSTAFPDPLLTSVAGISGYLHLFSERRSGHHFRYYSQISRAPPGCGGWRLPTQGCSHSE
jgi:CBS domain-containing protein